MPLTRAQKAKLQNKRPKKPFVFTRGRQESLQKAHKKMAILLAIGKKYLPVEAKRLRGIH